MFDDVETKQYVMLGILALGLILLALSVSFLFYEKRTLKRLKLRHSQLQKFYKTIQKDETKVKHLKITKEEPEEEV